jgi:predicted DNA-binding transcriptional regulator YafY
MVQVSARESGNMARQSKNTAEDEFDERNSDDIQALRLSSLMIGLAASRVPMPTATIRSLYYPGLDEQAFFKKFQRDRKMLSTCGVAVVESGRNASGALWAIDAQATFAQAQELTRQDAAFIDVAGMPLANDPAFPYRDELTLALAKINRRYNAVVTRRDAAGGKAWDSTLADLLDALQSRHPIDVRYQPKDAAEKDYCLALYGSFGFREQTYFVACEYDRGSRAIASVPRTYRLDRFRKVRAIASRTYTVPEDFCISDFVRLPFQMGEATLHASFSPLGMAGKDAHLRTSGVTELTARGYAMEDGTIRDVPVANEQVAAAWSIDAGVVPMEPESLVQAYRGILLSASDCQPQSLDPWLAAGKAHASNAHPRRRGRKGGVLEARQLSALIGSLDEEGATISANVVAQRLGCTIAHAKHLLSLLIDASDEESLNRLPLATDDDMSEAVLLFNTIAGRPIRLTLTESVALIAALLLAGVEPQDPLFQKLSQSLSAAIGDAPTVASLVVARQEPSSPEALPTCADAITNRRIIWFGYTSTTGQHSRRLVKPSSISHRDGQWYLEGYDLSRSAMRNFRIDRMTDVTIAKDHANVPEIAPDGTPQRTINFVLLDQALADALPWNQTSFTPLASGATLVRCPYFGGTWLPRRLAACGGAIAIDDADMCKLVRQYAKSALQA